MDRATFLSAWTALGEALADRLPATLNEARLKRVLERVMPNLAHAHVALGIPCRRDALQETLATAMSLNFDLGIEGLSNHSFEVASNREALVKSAIEMGFDRLLFLDSDNVVGGVGFARLMETMDQTGAALVAAPVEVRTNDHSVLYNVWLGGGDHIKQMDPDDVPMTFTPFPAHHCGLAVSLLDLVQLKRFKGPRFGRWVAGMDHKGEDQIFCEYLRANKLEFIIDPAPTTGHLFEKMHVYPGAAAPRKTEEPGPRTARATGRGLIVPGRG